VRIFIYDISSNLSEDNIPTQSGIRLNIPTQSGIRLTTQIKVAFV
jgi:hypothetical protein